MSKTIFMSTLAFKLSIRLLLLSLISPMQRYMKMSSFRFGSGDFDVLSPLLCSVVLVSDVVVDFSPSAFMVLAWVSCVPATSCPHMNTTIKYEMELKFTNDRTIYVACKLLPLHIAKIIRKSLSSAESDHNQQQLEKKITVLQSRAEIQMKTLSTARTRQNRTQPKQEAPVLQTSHQIQR